MGNEETTIAAYSIIFVDEIPKIWDTDYRKSNGKGALL